jgi:hypothetical protein
MSQNPQLPPRDAGTDVHAKFFDVHPELISPGYLNNFPEKYKPAYRATHTERIKVHVNNRSSLRNSQALDEFLAQLDVAAKEIDMARFLALSTEIEIDFKKGFWKLMGNDPESRRLIEALDVKKAERDAMIIPVYLRLRSQGYNHNDLTG